MSDNKKYYYLKLKENFFDSAEIKVLESMPNGYKYSNLLLKLYLKSLKFEGMLRLNEYIPYSPEMIAAITGHDIDTVRMGLKIFTDLKLIEILDDGTIFVLEIQNFIGKSSTEADRKRRYRQEINLIKNKVEEKNQLTQGQMSGQMSDKNPPEKEIEKEIEIEKDIEIEKETIIKKVNNCCDIEIFKHFEKCGFRLTPLQYEEIVVDIDKFSTEWIKDAAIEASNRGKLNYSYVRGILENWLANGKNSSEFKKTKNRKNPNSKNKKDTFNNFDQREYNFEELETDLTGWYLSEESEENKVKDRQKNI